MSKTFGQRVAEEMMPVGSWKCDDIVLPFLSGLAAIIDRHDAERMKRLREWCDTVKNYAETMQLSAVARGDAGAVVESATFLVAQSQMRAILDDMEATDGKD